MTTNRLLIGAFIILLLSVIKINAHDSHTHQAPWESCENKKKTEECSYKNGDGDLFKGSCQLFQEALMCVRNEPIIHVEDLTKKVNHSADKHRSDAFHSHE